MPARQRDLRTSNLAGVLAAVAGAPVAAAPSRAALAGLTGLTRTTVSALVDLLLEARLVEEVEPGPRLKAGRPAAGLRISGSRIAALGAEIGVDYLAVCVRDLGGTVRERLVVPGDNRGSTAEEVLARSAALAGAVLRAAAAEGLVVVGAAWAVPGLVDAERGRVLVAPNLGWSDVPAARLLAPAPELEALVGTNGPVGSPAAAPASAPAGLGRPAVTVDNEATLAALAELGHPAPSSAGSLLRVSGEVGVGAGLVLDGRLARGQHGWSGELGHVTVEPDGPRCRCGARGCLEVYAGQEAILRAAGRADGGVPAATTLGALGGGGGLVALVALASDGDPRVLAALQRAGRALGVAVASAVNLLDVDAVVFGGIYAPLAPWLLPAVTAEVDVRVLRARWAPVPVRPSTIGADAAVLGAAATVLSAALEHPLALLAT